MNSNLSQQTLTYLRETLGIRYIPRSSVSYEPHPDKTLKHPGFSPKMIFVNFDEMNVPLSSDARDVFEKIVKAMGLALTDVWWAEASHMGFVDFLTIIRRWHFDSPLVVLKQDPEIKQEVQSTGPHQWIECYSLNRMIKKTELKKITWKQLQLLIPSGTPL